MEISAREVFCAVLAFVTIVAILLRVLFRKIDQRFEDLFEFVDDNFYVIRCDIEDLKNKGAAETEGDLDLDIAVLSGRIYMLQNSIDELLEGKSVESCKLIRSEQSFYEEPIYPVKKTRATYRKIKKSP